MPARLIFHELSAGKATAWKMFFMKKNTLTAIFHQANLFGEGEAKFVDRGFVGYPKGRNVTRESATTKLPISKKSHCRS